MAAREEAYLEFDGLALHFDVVTSELTEHTATPTTNAVERGVDVSDHIKQEADHVTLEVFVSNTPIRDVNGLYNGTIEGLELDVPKPEKTLVPTPGALFAAATDAILDALNGPERWKAQVLKFPTKFNAVKDTRDALLDWKERGLIGKVITPHGEYDSMAITKVSIARNASTGDGAPITIELQHVRIVETRQLTVPIPEQARAKAPVAKGKQPPVPAPEKEKSMAKFLIGGPGRR